LRSGDTIDYQRAEKSQGTKAHASRAPFGIKHIPWRQSGAGRRARRSADPAGIDQASVVLINGCNVPSSSVFFLNVSSSTFLGLIL